MERVRGMMRSLVRRLRGAENRSIEFTEAQREYVKRLNEGLEQHGLEIYKGQIVPKRKRDGRIG